MKDAAKDLKTPTILVTTEMKTLIEDFLKGLWLWGRMVDQLYNLVQHFEESPIYEELINTWISLGSVYASVDNVRNYYTQEEVAIVHESLIKSLRSI